ncbi:hypothetical protein B7705_00980 [Streptococcus oralis subsp. dentisani]|uniref:Uncharacterized protein n=1 Tax=Streptococcus oralis subsp. dentisani TaxID=1458253 RepID=A0A1X1JEE9_STROR|nr:hypothetical protein B7705_00980 [Streptococcus oralis subsp. dentisani]
MVIAEVFKQDTGCFNLVEACPNLVDLLFSEFVEGFLIGIETIEKVDFITRIIIKLFDNL